MGQLSSASEGEVVAGPFLLPEAAQGARKELASWTCGPLIAAEDYVPEGNVNRKYCWTDSLNRLAEGLLRHMQLEVRLQARHDGSR